MRAWIRRSAYALAGAFVLVQLVPYGRAHDNPPVVREPAWDAPRTRELAARACFDCHSHETIWPWYSHVAPMSWLVQHDVDEGRDHLNFSRWDERQRNAREAAEEVEEGAMPPSNYTLAHPEARLTAAERAELVSGLGATMGGDRRGRGRDGNGRGGDEDRRDDE